MAVSELFSTEMENAYHYPVMYKEIIDFLEIHNKKIIVDCTVGIGSHAREIFRSAPEGAFLVGIDKDENSLEIAGKRLEEFYGRYALCKGNFSNLDNILNDLNIKTTDAFLFDLGISTYQLSDPQRGFSFLKEGPLDMRMDEDSFVSAYDLVNNLSEIELGTIFKKFGEERYYKRISHSLVEARKKGSIFTTTQLAQIIKNSVPLKNQYGRIHPATRIFQSLRIAVNRELESLDIGVRKAVSMLNKGGRIAVISFHSLEDRIVKRIFREYSSQNILRIITKKPQRPGELELRENSRSRSAKLRIAEKN